MKRKKGWLDELKCNINNTMGFMVSKNRFVILNFCLILQKTLLHLEQLRKVLPMDMMVMRQMLYIHQYQISLIFQKNIVHTHRLVILLKMHGGCLTLLLAWHTLLT